MEYLVEVKIESEKKDVKAYREYAVSEIFERVGLPFRIVSKYGGAPIKVSITEDESTYDSRALSIYTTSLNEWLNNEVKVKTIRNKEILYINNPPKYLIRNDKVGFDVLNMTLFMLGGMAERKGCTLDRLNRLKINRGSVLKKISTRVPIVDECIKPIKNHITEKLEKRNKSYRSDKVWGVGTEVTVAITHDIDNVYEYSLENFSNSLNSIVRDKRISNQKRFLIALGILKSIVKSFKRLKTKSYVDFGKLASNRKKGINTTYYVSTSESKSTIEPNYRLDEKIQLIDKMVGLNNFLKRIKKNGDEVGLHASVESSNSEAALKEEKERLEKALCESVEGVRHHRLSYNRSRTPNNHDRCNFKYDSTIGFNKKVGFRSGTAQPHRNFDFERSRVSNHIEIPLAAQDISLMRHGEEALNVFTELIENAKNVNGIVVLNWHPVNVSWSLNSGDQLFHRIIQKICHENVRCLTMSDIADKWILGSNRVG